MSSLLGAERASEMRAQGRRPAQKQALGSLPVKAACLRAALVKVDPEIRQSPRSTESIRQQGWYWAV